MGERQAFHSVCPLAAVDKRLADVHNLWHQAEAAYFDPEGFRLALQNTIQTLRTVTFILQKNKSTIPNFNDWYGDWQRRLASDSLMRWMIDARNRIEKQGDLEAHSMIRAEVVASYLDEGPRIDVPAHLFDSVTKLIQCIPNTDLGEHIRRNGMLRIQRRWVENTLPNYELLEAAAVAYGKIAELVHDAHRQLGLDPPLIIHDDDGNCFDLASMGWRFPCMVSHDLPKALLFSLADGSRMEFKTKHVPMKLDAPKIASLIKRYGRNPFEALKRYNETDAELAAGFFTLARTMFLRDGYHITLILFVRDRQPIGPPTQVFFENVQHKYALMRKLAADAITLGADAVMLISEVWKALATELKPYERATDSSSRTEALNLHLVSKNGTSIAYEADIIRSGKKISLGKTHTIDHAAAFEFAPFLQVWGCPVPESWLETSRIIMAAAKPE